MPTGSTQGISPRRYVPGGIKEMLVVTLPMMASAACDTVMTFTDRFFLSKLGPVQMNASMAGGLTCFMLTTFFIGLTGYCTALVAQYLGSDRKSQCAVAVTQALIVSLIAYPLILSLRPVGHWLFQISNVPPEQLEPQKKFFNILLWGAILSLTRNSLSGFFSGIGRTRIVMVSALVAMTVNIVANYALVLGGFGCPRFGIAGSAVGSLIGGTCGLTVLLVGYLWKSNRVEFGVLKALRYDKSAMGKLLRFGTPSGLELFLNLLAFDLIILTFHGRGLEAATATTVVFNWDMVSFVPMLGVNIGVMSLVGRYMGAGKPDIANRATMSGLRLALLYSFCALIAFAFFAKPLVHFFRPEIDTAMFDRTAPLATRMLRFASLYVLADATSLVFSGALRGAGDTLWAMIISVGLHWTLLAVVFVLLHVMRLPVFQGWLALVFLVQAWCGIFYLRYRTGRWRSIKVVQPITEPPVAALADGLHETPDL